MNFPSVIPTIRYKNAQKAYNWLHQAFGFEKHMIHEIEGIVVHAQMIVGGGMIMLGTLKENDYDRLLTVPAEVSGKNTQAPYIIIDDGKLDLHYKTAKQFGVEIILPLKEEPHGKGYTCKDLEGHIWSFGNYNPFK